MWDRWHKCPNCGYVFAEREEAIGWPRIAPYVAEPIKVDPYVAPLPKFDRYEYVPQTIKVDPYVAPLPEPASFCYKSGYDYDRVQHRI